MAVRLSVVFAAALLMVGILSAPASAQQVAPNAQVGQYIEPEHGGGQAPQGEAGASGQLAFTGLTLLPIALIGSALVFGAVAVRRRAVRLREPL